MMGTTCKDVADLCTDFEEGAMTWAGWASFRLHIALCPPCKEYVRQMNLTAQILHQAEPPKLDDATRSELVATFKKWRADRED